MNILIFTLEFPPMIGGAGTYSFELASALTSLSHRVHVLTSNRGLLKEEAINRYPFLVFRKKWSRMWFWTWPRFFRKHLSLYDYDLVVFANQGAVLVGAKVRKIQPEYLCTLHGSERYTFLSKKYSIKTKLLTSREKITSFLSGSKKVVCVSKDLFIDVKALVPPHLTLQVIPLGLSSLFLYKRSFSRVRTKSIVDIVCTARFIKGKGQDIVLRSFYELIKHDRKFRLSFIGSGEEESNVKGLCNRLGLQEYVAFKGSMDRKDIADYYRQADIFIMLSSLKETFGLVYLEAMSSGLPVIGSDVGAVSNLIISDYNGYLINMEAASTEDVKDMILKTTAEIERLSSNAFDFASRYSNVSMAKQHLI